MDDQAERRKRLKAMRDEASAAVDRDPGSSVNQSLANPLAAPEVQNPQQLTPVFSFYSDPLGSLQSRPAASKAPALQHRLGRTEAAQQTAMSRPADWPPQQQTNQRHTGGMPQHQSQYLQQPQSAAFDPSGQHVAFGAPQQHPTPPHLQPFHSQANEGRGYHPSQQWQGPTAQQGRGPPGRGPQHVGLPGRGAPGFTPGMRPPGLDTQGRGPPRRGPPGLGLPGRGPPGWGPPASGPPASGPPSRGPPGRGFSGRGAPGRRGGREGGAEQWQHARGRGRGGRHGGGRGRGSGSHGGQDNIEAYVSPAMLQDPWASLMKQHLSQQTQQQILDAPAPHPVDSINAGAGNSLSDAFEAVEQEAQGLQQEGVLSEEGVSDRPWH